MTQNRYFRHFKGGLYKLLYEVRDSETREEAFPYSELPICSHLKKKQVGEYAHLMEVVEGDER